MTLRKRGRRFYIEEIGQIAILRIEIIDPDTHFANWVLQDEELKRKIKSTIVATDQGFSYIYTQIVLKELIHTA